MAGSALGEVLASSREGGGGTVTSTAAPLQAVGDGRER